MSFFVKNIDINDSSKTIKNYLLSKNLSDEKIEVINAVVLFYKEGKIVKIDEVYGFDVMPGRSVSETYEYKDKYDAFEFDDCKVLVNEAYSSNY